MNKKKVRIPMRAYRAALSACDLLCLAYKLGEERGGSIDWNDLGLAYETALRALAIAEGK